MFVANLAGTGNVTTFTPGVDTLYIKVSDPDLNTNGTTIQSVQVNLTASNGDSENITLIETGINTGIFTGSILTVSSSTFNAGNLRIEAKTGTVVTVSYLDAIDANNNVNQIRTDSVVANSVGFTGSVMFVADLAGNGDVATFVPGVDSLFVKVVDSDLNTNNTTLQTVQVSLTGSNGDSETMLLTETGVNTGIFTGTIPTVGSFSPFLGNGKLEAGSGNTVTVTYVDVRDADGNVNQNRVDTVRTPPPPAQA